MNVEKLRAIALRDICPICFGELDTGWECNNCGYDARPLVERTLPGSNTASGEANA